jgi:nucleotide-binding universal stress UspA family protein
MSNTIVIGTDGSAQAEGALRYGAALARARDAHVVVATAYQHLPPLRGDGGAFERFARADAEEAAMRGVALIAGTVAARPLVAAGTSLWDALHRVAEAEQAELLVIGTSARKRIAGLQPGSVTEHVVHHSPCPVLAVPPFEGEPRFSRIGIALDAGSPARAALELALDLARGATPREFRLVHVAPEDHVPQPGTTPANADRAAARRLLDEVANAISHRGHVEVVDATGDAAKELVRMSEDLDLLVCGSRDHGVVKRLLLGSVSTHVVRNATCPVLVAPATAGPALSDVVPSEERTTA